MGIEFIKGLLKETVEIFEKPKTYDGMEGDILLVSQTIIPQDVTQNAETIPTDGIGEGIPEDALKRLRKVSDLEKIARQINRRFGHGNPGYEIKLDTQTLKERLGELEESSRYEG
jgi:hypothetical protein